MIGSNWQNEWMAEGLSSVPRPFLATALADDPEQAMQEMMQEVEQSPIESQPQGLEAFRQLEAAVRQVVLLAHLQQIVQNESWAEPYQIVRDHPELLAEEVGEMWA